MDYCPSKGRLLELEKELGVKPYYDYCGHCDYYRAAIEKAGFCFVADRFNVDEARCTELIYDPKVFKGVLNMTEEVEKLELKAQTAEYFHRDFHSSLNMGVDFVAKEHGLDALIAFLEKYTKDVYIPVIKEMETAGALKAIENNIVKTYTLEKALDVLHIESDDQSMKVKIDYCPAVKHLHETGRVVSDYFKYSTEVVMRTLAEIGGLSFTMESYNEETGAAAFSFRKISD